MKNEAQNPQVNFTKREEEILLLVAKGFVAKEVADKLFIAERTVVNHKAKMFDKFDAKSMAQLMYIYMTQKIQKNSNK